MKKILDKPLISVIIAAYNAESHLKQCLDSIIMQTYSNIEIICVNDGSTDRTHKICAEYAERDSRVKIINQENSGSPSKARNSGLRLAKGDLLTFVDSDDYIANNCFESCLEQIKNTGCKIALFDIELFNEAGVLPNSFLISNNQVFDGKKAFYLSLDWKIPGLGIWDISLFQGTQFCEKGMNGDEFTARILLLKSDKVCLSTGKYFYRQHSNSITKDFSLRTFESKWTKYDLFVLTTEKRLPQEYVKKAAIRTLNNFLKDIYYFHNKKYVLNSHERIYIRKDLNRFYNEAYDKLKKEITIGSISFLRRSYHYLIGLNFKVFYYSFILKQQARAFTNTSNDKKNES